MTYRLTCHAYRRHRKPRDEFETLKGQLEAAGHRQQSREQARRETLDAVDSLTGFEPALAALDGLSTPPYLLFDMMGFDALHVRWSVAGPVLRRHAIYRGGTEIYEQPSSKEFD